MFFCNCFFLRRIVSQTKKRGPRSSMRPMTKVTKSFVLIPRPFPFISHPNPDFSSLTMCLLMYLVYGFVPLRRAFVFALVDIDTVRSCRLPECRAGRVLPRIIISFVQIRRRDVWLRMVGSEV